MKRSLDVFAAALGLILLFPLLVYLACRVRFALGAPIFFRQMRPGKNGKPYKMIKFRTMIDAYDTDGKELADEHRTFKFGAKLRSSSLDELPELWNVLKGEMSIVGPRPLLMEYMPLYSDEQARRHAVRPGITGWAQVNGRNSISWDEKFIFDVWYVDNQSIWLDFKIIWMTFKKVWDREGISASQVATMPKFTGKN